MNQLIDEIKRIGYKYATIYGMTISLDTCDLDIFQDVKKRVYQDSDPTKQLILLNSKLISKTFKDNYKYWSPKIKIEDRLKFFFKSYV
jgi:hypothetical protein